MTEEATGGGIYMDNKIQLYDGKEFSYYRAENTHLSKDTNRYYCSVK